MTYNIYKVSRHKKILNLYDKVPKIGSNTFIAPSSSVIGDVQIGNGSSVWYGSVLRGIITKDYKIMYQFHL